LLMNIYNLRASYSGSKIRTVQYRMKRFFSGVHACVSGADALTNFT
jgi:hypothetical protein